MSNNSEGRNAADFENEIFPKFDFFSIDAVGESSDDDDSDDGNNGDFEEFADEPFVEVTRGRSASRSPATSRTSTSRSSISSVALVPPTPTSNVFSPLLESEDVPTAVPSAPVSWDFRQPLEHELFTAERQEESVTDRIFREVNEAKLRFAHFVPHETAPTCDVPPGLEPVPVSCYSGSFMTWSFNDVMEEFESEIDDSESVDERCHVEGTPVTEHFKIDTPDVSNQIALSLRSALRLRPRCPSIPAT